MTVEQTLCTALQYFTVPIYQAYTYPVRGNTSAWLLRCNNKNYWTDSRETFFCNIFFISFRKNGNLTLCVICMTQVSIIPLIYCWRWQIVSNPNLLQAWQFFASDHTGKSVPIPCLPFSVICPFPWSRVPRAFGHAQEAGKDHLFQLLIGSRGFCKNGGFHTCQSTRVRHWGTLCLCCLQSTYQQTSWDLCYYSVRIIFPFSSHFLLRIWPILWSILPFRKPYTHDTSTETMATKSCS